MSRRVLKLNELIKRELGQIILERFSFSKEFLVTLTKVETSDDLSQSRVYISVIPDSEADRIIKKLKNKERELQKYLGDRIKIKKTPKIKIKEDIITKKADRVEKILKDLKEE